MGRLCQHLKFGFCCSLTSCAPQSSVSLSYFLSIFYQFQSITIHVALLLSSCFSLQIISCTFPFSFLVSALVLSASFLLLLFPVVLILPPFSAHLPKGQMTWNISVPHSLPQRSSSPSKFPHSKSSSYDRRKDRTVHCFFVTNGNNLQLI